MGLEINLIRFIPLISNKFNIFSSEASIKYFLTQALASTAFLLRIISLIIFNRFNEFFFINRSILMILNSSLLLKIGAAPFHFWFPEVINKINWSQRIILLTWQKIAPIILISYTFPNNNFSYFVIISSITIGRIIGLNQTSIKKILVYSSINHIGWILSRIFFIERIWMIYFSIYSILTISLILILKMSNINIIKQIYSNLNNEILIKFTLIINFLSLAGLPPFIGFLPKWIIIQNLINEKFYILTLFIISITLITLFFYLRITFSVIIMSYSEPRNKNNKNFNKKKIILFLINLLSITGLIFCTITINFI